MEYDYIIAGSGCAGLSLLYRILKEPTLSHKKILVLDRDQKTENDRTWCYWEKGDGLFEHIVHHSWQTLEFLTEKFTRQFDLKEYRYKMIRGIDFYNLIIPFAKTFKNVVLKHEQIERIASVGDTAIVQTTHTQYKSKYVFNSTNLYYPTINPDNSLLQHFEGWVIQTETPVFDSKIGTLMDFSLNQQHGATFMYMLPTSSTEALVEYTLFSEKVLDKSLYQKALQHYIKHNLQVDQYTILHKEFGVIPMSLAQFSANTASNHCVVNIGTAGGFTKASTGYTFQFVQKNTQAIVQNLVANLSPHQQITFRDKMFSWYDKTLLEVLMSKKMTGKEVFAIMFEHLSPDKILAFLANESSFWEEIKIMNSVPKKTFILAGLKQIL